MCPGVNKKPVVTITAPASSPVTTNTPIFTGYDVSNPETATLNEAILTTNSCSYVENTNSEETFESFDFGTLCGQAVIGSRKGVNFGAGLDLTQCGPGALIAADIKHYYFISL